MDPKAAGVLLSIPEFKGMSTNPPRGTVLAPELLLNVYLDRTGGYSPMHADALRRVAVTRALGAGLGDDLFIQRVDDTVEYWQPQTGGNVIPGVSLTGAVLIMPGVLLTQTGETWVTRLGTQPGTLNPGTVSDTGTPDLKWAYVDVGAKTEPPLLAASTLYQIAIEWLPTPTKPFRGVSLFNVGSGVGSPPTYFSVELTVDAADPPRFNVYIRPGSSFFRFVGSNVQPGSRGDARPISSVQVVDFDPAYGKGDFIPGTTMRFALSNSASAYHQGRAYLAPESVTYDRVNEEEGPALIEGKTRVTEAHPRRLYFSEVTADGTSVLPAFSLINYIDVPFKVSRRIIALASVGPYLYIFGDRELLILTGDPSTDGRIESIGDSIGAVTAGSVQQLSGTVFWLSDSGVMAAQGAQVREVGADVRDMLLELGVGISSTVDFKREIYHLMDGMTHLCYHAREGGWTQRDTAPVITPGLVSGGGTPYLIRDNSLYSIGGEKDINGLTPPQLPMTVRWPSYELGSWLTRKTFRAVACGLDGSAFVVNDSQVDLNEPCDTSQTPAEGNTGLRLHTSKGGVSMTGVGIAVRLVVTPYPYARCILRPPLTIHGSVNGEEAFTDGR